MSSAQIRLLSIMFFVGMVLILMAACAHGRDRRCEHDSSDTPVSASWCEEGTPGYEWETVGGSPKRHKVKGGRPSGRPTGAVTKGVRGGTAATKRDGGKSQPSRKSYTSSTSGRSSGTRR